MLTALVVVILPSSPLWFLGSQYFIDRAIFNLDSAICVAIMIKSPLVGALLLLLAWGADLIVAFSATYHFTRPMDFLAGARFLSDVRLSDMPIGPFVAGISLFGGVLGALWIATHRVRLSLLSAAVLLLLLAGLDAANGSSALWSRDVRVASFNLAGSPGFTLAAEAARTSSGEPLSPLGAGEGASESMGVSRWAAANPDRGIVFVIVESFGWLKDEALRRWLFARATAPAIAAGYRVTEMPTHFRGATTAGELRQLCGLSGPFSSVDTIQGRRCLPYRLSESGWHTVGLHGFTSRMFDRGTWWPHIGIKESIFGDAVSVQSWRRCGAAFRGLCDADVIEKAFEFARRPRTFAYVLTLNTHLPLEQMPVPPELRERCQHAALPDRGCLLVSTLGDVLETIGAGAAASPHAPLVIVVGDHAPPFGQIDLRESFDQQNVPLISLAPAGAR